MIFEAIKLVAEAHQGQYRKGTNIPYISHLMDVMKILCESGCNEEVISAGILHDTVEDTSVTHKQLEQIFGEKVASIVKGASEPEDMREVKNTKNNWRDRKQHTIDFITNKASYEQLLVSCADKLDNITAIKQDFDHMGDQVWERFNAPKPDQEWYYRSIAKAFEKRAGGFGEPLTNLSKRLSGTVNEVF
jgi:(p)ppGpp synthase/HD superfamily hydrolase